MAADVSISEGRIRVVQPDGGPPCREIYASSGPQGRILRERLLGRPASTIARVSDSDRPPGQADPGDNHNRKHNLWRAGRRERG